MIQLCSLIVLANLGQATPPPDPLRKALIDSKLIYSDAGDFFSVEVRIDDANRKQIVYLRKSVETYGTLKERELFSIIWDSPTPPTADFQLKVATRSFNLGGLAYELPSEAQKHYRWRYRFTIPDDVSPDRLRFLVLVAGSVADKLDKEFNKEDLIL